MTSTAHQPAAAIDASAGGAQVEQLRAAIRFEKGNPSDAEIAAIISVLAAQSGGAGGGDSTPAAPRSLWGDSRDRLRPQYFNGPLAYTSQTPLFWTKGS